MAAAVEQWGRRHLPERGHEEMAPAGVTGSHTLRVLRGLRSKIVSGGNRVVSPLQGW
jgi:hypothetical protein